MRYRCTGGCGKTYSERSMVQREGLPMCHKCFNALVYANAPGPKPPSGIDGQRRRLRKYKLTDVEYDELLAGQGGVCAICQGAPLGQVGLVIDHNHDTGAVRGLLCGTCNTALGLFQDDPDLLDRAVKYLTERGNYARRRAGR